MRRILAGSVGLALGLGALRGYAQELTWQPAGKGAAARQPTVTLGPPVASLGAPRAMSAPRTEPAFQPVAATIGGQHASRVVRAQVDDKAPMPPGPVLSGGTTNGAIPLPPPTPLNQYVPAPDGMFGGPVVSGPVASGPIPGGVPCPDCVPAPGAVDPSLAPLPGGVFVPPTHPTGYLLNFNAELLMWWIQNGNVPPLLVTGVPLPNTAIGNPQTVVGNSWITGQERVGGRFTFGWWFSPCRNWGLEASYFFLGQRDAVTSLSDPGTGVLARPYLLPTPMGLAPQFEIIAYPGLSGGSFVSSASNSLWGADINLKKNLWLGCCARLDMLYGFRYLNFEESLLIEERFMALPGSAFAGASGAIMDQFETSNNFYGGQMGLNAELRRGRWSLNLLTKVAMGTTQQTVGISGSQVITGNGVNAIPGMYPGLLAQPSNIGRHTRDVYSVVPEVGVNVGWQMTNHVKLFVGYNLLYWSNVLRAGDQIDPVLDVVPSRNAAGAAVAPLIQRPGAVRPMVPFKESDLWAQGINFGLQLTW
jgi:hypothetical protein